MDTWKLGLLMSGICAALGLQVTIPQTTYEIARGDEVTITCNFQPKNLVNQLIVITWSGDPDGSFDDEGITFGTYYSNINHVDISAMYEGKAHIISDVNKKESKLLLKHVTLRESRRIKCFVQIPGDTEGQTSDSTSLVVLVAPSDPICRIKGTAVYGQNISLTCESEEGSPVPTYQWQSYDVKNIPRPFPPKTIEKDGVLSLFNVSRDTSGYYICTSTNMIHSAKCNLTMSVMPSTMNIGTTAAIIGGCVAGVAVLVLIIYCCCRNKQQPEEFAMEHPVIEYQDIPKQEDGPRNVRKISIEGHIEHEESYEGKAEKDRNNDLNQRFCSEDHQNHPERHDHRDIFLRGRNEGQREQHDDHKAFYKSQQNRYDERRSEYDNPRDSYDCSNDQHDRYRYQRDRNNDRQYRSNDHIERYDNRHEHYSDNGRDQYCQNRYYDRNSFEDCREDYDDRRVHNHNLRYQSGDRQDRYND